MPDRHRGFFLRPALPAHRLYEALRAVIVEGEPVGTVAPRFHYTPGSLAVLCSRFRAGALPPFFLERRPGPSINPRRPPPGTGPSRSGSRTTRSTTSSGCCAPKATR